MREWVALSRATEEELDYMSKATSARQSLFGVYVKPPTPTVAPVPAIAPLRDVRKPVSTKGPESELEREIRAYARTNRCSLEESRDVLTTLV